MVYIAHVKTNPRITEVGKQRGIVVLLPADVAGLAATARGACNGGGQLFIIVTFSISSSFRSVLTKGMAIPEAARETRSTRRANMVVVERDFLGEKY